MYSEIETSSKGTAATPIRLSALLSAGILAVLLWTLNAGAGAEAQTAPDLGEASSYAVLGGQTVTNAGPSTVRGDLGVSPGTAVTGFPPGIVTGGTIHSADADALQAQAAVTTTYNALAAEACSADLTGQDLGGMTLTEGVYCFTSSAQLTGLLTLDAQGNASAVFVFKMVSTLTTASNSSVMVINGSTGCNVFWQVGSSATIGTGTVFVGNILALTSISLTTGASVSGRALARNGAVTMQTNDVGFSSCAGATATATAPASPTATGLVTESPTITAGPTGTATPTATVTVTATPSPTALTATPIGQTPAPTPTGTTTPTTTATPTPTTTPTPIGQTPSPTATPVGPTATATPTPVVPRFPNTGGHPTEGGGTLWFLMVIALFMTSVGALLLARGRSR